MQEHNKILDELQRVMDDILGGGRSASKVRDSKFFKKKNSNRDNTAVFAEVPEDGTSPLKNSVVEFDLQLPYEFPKIDKDNIKNLEPN